MKILIPMLVILIGYAIFAGVAHSIRQVDDARKSCAAADGHFINQHGMECWSADGTRRLFPDGFNE